MTVSLLQHTHQNNKTRKATLSFASLLRLFSLFMVIALSGCQTLYSDSELYQNQKLREQSLSDVNDWLIRGKIAFIAPDEKQSANLYWRRIGENQQLRLTTFLGVNVLSLESKDGMHTITVDGNTYQDQDLDYLIQSVSGIALPVAALSQWLKGLPYSESDQFQYSDSTQLPSQLSAEVNGKQYQLEYQSYTLVNNLRLTNKLSIDYKDMRIKLAISEWELL
ncbi:outer membrane lipoprotein LolB [Thalassotalea sp. HSM 43]|uniref:lipoprotein insertase outer membrane protein LolB n=1 Tax=Thalassotalea sp. HSM 43 TaxID=2552945 RepID=UPI0010818F38|nr:lipoprotein insertase outer membrane protein LolB [Thalassotalea sp. HSM 43]QBY03221.1 outer membrane lipoprotein LolB [Thalassotalea sp. HSM 43]